MGIEVKDNRVIGKSVKLGKDVVVEEGAVVLGKGEDRGRDYP